MRNTDRSTQAAGRRRRAQAQLREQMAALVGDLARGHADPRVTMLWAELGAVEDEPARRRFGVDRPQVHVDGVQRTRAGAEAVELWVVAVPHRLAAQDLARQQPLAPQSDEAPRVEERGMQGPQPHRGGYWPMVWIVQPGPACVSRKVWLTARIALP